MFITVNGAQMYFSEEQLSNILGEYFAERSPIHEIRRRNMAEKPAKVKVRNNKGMGYSTICFDNGVNVYCWSLAPTPLEYDQWYDIQDVKDVEVSACFGKIHDLKEAVKFRIGDLIPI